jgi:hypothetical protein
MVDLVKWTTLISYDQIKLELNNPQFMMAFKWWCYMVHLNKIFNYVKWLHHFLWFWWLYLCKGQNNCKRVQFLVGPTFWEIPKNYGLIFWEFHGTYPIVVLNLSYRVGSIHNNIHFFWSHILRNTCDVILVCVNFKFI